MNVKPYTVRLIALESIHNLSLEDPNKQRNAAAQHNGAVITSLDLPSSLHPACKTLFIVLMSINLNTGRSINPQYRLHKLNPYLIPPDHHWSLAYVHKSNCSIWSYTCSSILSITNLDLPSPTSVLSQVSQ